MRGLYLHIPFCLKKCHYCNYVITANANDELRGRYFDALEMEIQHAVDQYGGLHFDTIYLGGGTPSALSGDEMARVFDLIHRSFTFEKNCEISCEVNPGEVNEEKLKTYRALGINRISLGAQSFNDHLLKEMGRIHDAQTIRDTVGQLKGLGFKNLSLDLIIRLPAH